MINSSSLFLQDTFKLRCAVPVALACAVLITGCSHTSSFDGQNQTVPVPAQWSGSTTHATASTPQDLSQWWQLFGDAQMTGLIEQALQANPSVQTAQAALRQARAQLGVSEANRLPSAGASLGGTRSKREPNSASNSFNAGIDASWEPDWWGIQSNQVKAAQANVAAALASLEGAHVSLAAEVAQNYIELRNLQNRLAIAESNLRIQSENEQITQWRVQAGLATSLDAEQAKASTAQTAAQIPALQASQAKALHALAILTGQVPTALVGSLGQPKALPQAPADLAMTLPADTLRQRPDVRAQEQKVVAAVANLSAQERANFPSLSLRGSLGLSAVTLSALGSSGATLATSIAASLSQTLFDGGANSARIQERQAAVEIARINYRSSVLSALQEVEDALVQLKGDQERLEQLKVAQEAATYAQLLASQRYSSGLVDFQTVLDTQRTLLSSQDSVATAQAAISTDYVRLYKALGGGWQPLGLDGQPTRMSTNTAQPQ
jgi:multidrug efflux system outer membrane protein